MASYDRLTTEQMQEALDLYAQCGCNTAELARRLKKPRTTVQNMVSRAKDEGLTPRSVPADTAPAAVTDMIETLRSEVDRLKKELAQATKPRFTVRHDLFASTSPVNVVAIGDAHKSPKIPCNRRFAWMGRYANERKPDVVVQIGDLLTFDSLNTHIPNENYDGKAKPSFIADIASGHEALDAFCAELKWGCEKHVTDGNHERRLYAFEDRAPEAIGMMQRDYDHLLESHGFTHSPYGEITYYGGVGFVHAALNTLGKTYGGKNSLPTIANDSISDLVVGHSHRARIHTAPKIGQRYPTTILDLGCSLPDGHVEDYATHALNGWTYGIWDIVIQHGHIQSAKFISMAELEGRYAA